MASGFRLQASAIRSRRARSPKPEARSLLSARFAAIVGIFAALAVPAFIYAQRGPAKADLTPIVDATQVRPGSPTHAALQVHLPEGYHTNSNKPRDPNLIPITLTFTRPLPAGISVGEVVF